MTHRPPPSLSASRFRLVFQEGRPLRGEHLTLWAHPRGAVGEPTRWGIVVSRKRMRRATERHRWKRRIRELVRLEGERISRGYEAILLVEQPAPEPTHAELRTEIEKLLRRAGLYVV